MSLLATGEDLDVCELEGAQAARQLAALLDDWWHAENQSGRTRIDAARAHAARRPPAAATFGPPTGLPVDPAQLPAITVVAPAHEVRLEGRPVDDDVIIWLAPQPFGLRPTGASWPR